MRAHSLSLAIALATTAALWSFGATPAGAPVPAAVGTILPYEASPELTQAMAPYHLRSYRHLGSNGQISFLLYRPPPPVRGTIPKSYPIVMFLHGAGEGGPDLLRMFKQPQLMQLASDEEQAKHPCYIFAPQHPAHDDWVSLHPINAAPPLVCAMEALECLRTRAFPPVDPNRIYVTGLSNGGHGAMEASTKFPNRFAAVVPIACLYSEQLINKHNANKFWWCYNDQDKSVINYVDYMQALGGKVRSLGGEFLIHAYSSRGHDAWSRTYSDPAMWQWLFTKELSDSMSARLNLAGRKVPKAFAAGPPAAPKSGPNNIIDGRLETKYVSQSPARNGNFVEVVFKTPTLFPKISVLTGDADGQRRVNAGRVDVSENGMDYETVCALRDGKALIACKAPIRVLRVFVTADQPDPLVVREICSGTVKERATPPAAAARTVASPAVTAMETPGAVPDPHPSSSPVPYVFTPSPAERTPPPEPPPPVASAVAPLPTPVKKVPVGEHGLRLPNGAVLEVEWVKTEGNCLRVRPLDLGEEGEFLLPKSLLTAKDNTPENSSGASQPPTGW